jgi:hypothetical protein
MADLHPLPASLTNRKGVASNSPTGPIILDISHAIATAVDALPPETSGAMVAIGTNTGVNFAVVHRIGKDRFAVAAWLGKDWGDRLEGGAAVRVTW